MLPYHERLLLYVIAKNEPYLCDNIVPNELFYQSLLEYDRNYFPTLHNYIKTKASNKREEITILLHAICTEQLTKLKFSCLILSLLSSYQDKTAQYLLAKIYEYPDKIYKYICGQIEECLLTRSAVMA